MMRGVVVLPSHVPTGYTRCGFCFSEVSELVSHNEFPRRRGGYCSFRRCRFGRSSSKQSKPGVSHSCREPDGSQQFKGGLNVKALRTDDEKRRFRSSPSPDYPPTGPPGPPKVDFEDELELPLLRGTVYGSPKRGPLREEEGGYPVRRDGFTARLAEEERSRPPQTLLTGMNKYILAGIFVLGMGAGITADTVLNVEPNNVASREVIDRQTPNPDVCIANGMSAMVLDQRLFISFNPFNVYVSQTEVKPGCVLRQSNWRVLETRGLVTSDEVRDCKRNMNTFGFVGDLRQAPEISCVYHSESAENQFLKDPSKATLGDGFQPKSFEE